jgi:GMP synthase (glutamine-hydrolysing)
MQLLARSLGGRLTREAHGEYGPAELVTVAPSALWKPLNGSGSLRVWMSHGDRVEEAPPGFEVTGRTADLPVAAMEDRERRVFGLQFHPEVHHTEKGPELLAAFLEEAGLAAGWSMPSFARDAVESIKAVVGPAGRVLCGLSGGVDSTVCAALLARAVGDRLHCVFVDNGLLRRDEAPEVAEAFRTLYPGLDLTVADAGDEFLSRLEGVSDPEEKRRRIGHTFIEVFRREAERIGATYGKPDFLAQGTLYPDVIESVSPQGPSALIKSHHNVGGLPAELGFTLIEPLKYLFKDEVRELGAELGVPESLLWRHPFPGPGLAIRIIGPVDRASLALLRDADAVVREERRASTSSGSRAQSAVMASTLVTARTATAWP